MKITVILNMSKKRAMWYLQALRERYDRPTAGWSRLVAMALREIYSLQYEESLLELEKEEG